MAKKNGIYLSHGTTLVSRFASDFARFAYISTFSESFIVLEFDDGNVHAYFSSYIIYTLPSVFFHRKLEIGDSGN